MSDAEHLPALRDVMAALEATCARLPETSRPYIGNAMLNLGLGYLIERHGQRGAASILIRVLGALSAEQLSQCEDRALDALRLDG
jgi:hypothetical protein